MTSGKGNGGTNGTEPMVELARLLDTWGGDPARWPQQVGQRIVALTASVPVAQTLLAEARTLDRLLDSVRDAPAMLPPGKASALVDRIVTAASGNRPASPDLPATSRSGNVVRLPVRAVGPVVVRPPVKRWHAAGLIAASLLIGILIGGKLNLTPVFQEMAEAIDPTSVAALDDLGEDETL